MIEIPQYQLSPFEQDALAHYPAIVTSELVESLQGSVNALQTILPELHTRGVRLRIVPERTNLTDLPECIDLKTYKTKEGRNKYDDSAGIYRSLDRLIVIKEEYLSDTNAINQKYSVLIHETAHAIWHTLVSLDEQALVERFYHQEMQQKLEPSQEYRLTNVSEFFAESFAYYVTPIYDGPQIISIMGPSMQKDHKSKGDLATANWSMFNFLQGKFGTIIHPNHVIGNRRMYAGFDFDKKKGLHLPREIVTMQMLERLTHLKSSDFRVISWEYDGKEDTKTDTQGASNKMNGTNSPCTRPLNRLLELKVA